MSLRQFWCLMKTLMTPNRLVTTAKTLMASSPERGKTFKSALKHITSLTIFQSNQRQQTTLHAMSAIKSITFIKIFTIAKVV